MQSLGEWETVRQSWGVQNGYGPMVMRLQLRIAEADYSVVILYHTVSSRPIANIPRYTRLSSLLSV